MRPPTWIALAAALSLAPFAACKETINESPCKDVPAGGCPLSHGVACDDPACEAAYACHPDGTWTLDHVCPARDASADVTPIDAALPPPFDASAIDAPPGAGGGPGCEPLQPSDCSLAAALACPTGCCDCSDLFVCTNGSWDLWGTCGDDTGIRPSH
jgi:hypothetical protein